MATINKEFEKLIQQNPDKLLNVLKTDYGISAEKLGKAIKQKYPNADINLHEDVATSIAIAVKLFIKNNPHLVSFILQQVFGIALDELYKKIQRHFDKIITESAVSDTLKNFGKAVGTWLTNHPDEFRVLLNELHMTVDEFIDIIYDIKHRHKDESEPDIIDIDDYQEINDYDDTDEYEDSSEDEFDNAIKNGGYEDSFDDEDNLDEGILTGAARGGMIGSDVGKVAGGALGVSAGKKIGGAIGGTPGTIIGGVAGGLLGGAAGAGVGKDVGSRYGRLAGAIKDEKQAEQEKKYQQSVMHESFNPLEGAECDGTTLDAFRCLYNLKG